MGNQQPKQDGASDAVAATTGSSSSASATAQQLVSASLLLEAALNGELDLVKKQVGYFLATVHSRTSDDPSVPDARLVAFVNAQDDNGNAAIHGAAFGGNVAVIQFLCSSCCGASLELKNNLGCSPLWLTAGYNRLEAFDFILSQQQQQQEFPLKNNDTLNVNDDGDNGKHPHQLPLLTTNSTGDSILLAAASRGHLQMIQKILEVATPQTAQRLKCQTNRSGDTPLLVAMAGILEDCRCDDESLEDESSSNTRKLIHLLIEPSILNQPNQRGVSPILMACERDWPNVLQILLENTSSDQQDHPTNGVDASSQSSTTSHQQSHNNKQQLLSPLAMAAFCGSEHVLSTLIERHHQQQRTLNEVNPSDGSTPLWMAARAGHTTCVKLLLQGGADASIASQKGVTPLDVARQRGRADIVTMLQGNV